jgi:CRISPR-associated protein Csy1
MDMGVVLEYLNKRMEAEKDESKRDRFSIETWIPDAAKKAKQLSMASHVCKFSHPDAKAAPVIANSTYCTDGYLRSGNVQYEHVECNLDAFGNAAAIGVYNFLVIKMNDGRTILDHLERDSDEIRAELSLFKENYDELREEFLAIKQSVKHAESDERLKQVYYPVADQYHLLSLLTPSLIVSELQGRVRAIREKSWAVRDKNNEQYGQDYEVLHDLTVVGFGGTKPQNISVLNSRNRGRVYFLSSCPPSIEHRDVSRPRRDFFANTLRNAWFHEEFRRLHTLLASQKNNLVVRDSIRQVINAIVDHVMISVYKLREEDPGWSEPFSTLPLAQKIWLDEFFADAREQQKEWLEEVALSFARWVMHSYGKVMKKEQISLGDSELAFLRDCIETAMLQDKENWA